MEKIRVTTRYKKMLADLYTPVGIYLRIRDKYPGSVLLESTDYHAAENSFSYIGIKPIAGMEVNKDMLEYKYPEDKIVRKALGERGKVPDYLMSFLQGFEPDGHSPVPVSQGLFGYTAFEAIRFFETLEMRERQLDEPAIPLLRYRLYQYVIAINHFKDELYLCENQIDGVESEFEQIETLIRIKDCPVYPFHADDEELRNMSDEDYKEMVEKGIQHCRRGDVFQIVLSRCFQKKFRGDEFNVYRALRSINPSPYLFYFDYGDYRLMGSSPESQLIVKGNKAIIHPIAGTVKRTGDDEQDRALTEKLLNDPKENAEHVMLVDLARNDLSRFAKDVHVTDYRKVHAYSHVIHLVSEVMGTLPENINPFALLAACFPAGTLSGAPKYKAMELIDSYEPTARGYYAGCIGFVGFNGDFNHAIMIRSFQSRNNTLTYQAGAGIVSQSVPENELQEVNNKLNALKQALKLAENI
jgi:anthranilate synthase component 1